MGIGGQERTLQHVGAAAFQEFRLLKQIHGVMVKARGGSRWGGLRRGKRYSEKAKDHKDVVEDR